MNTTSPRKMAVPNFYIGCLMAVGTLLTLSFILSAAETAFTSLNPNQVRNLEKGHPKKMLAWSAQEERTLAAMLIGINLMTAGMGSVAAILAQRIQPASVPPALVVAAVTALLGLLMLFMGSILPKALARQNPERWALALSGPVWGLSFCLAPLTERLVGMLGKRGKPWSSRSGPGSPLSPWELREILAHSSIPYKSKKILTNLVQFPTLPVRFVMTPRDQIFSVDIAQKPAEMIESVAKSPYSRIPVTRGRSLDNVIGIVYSRDLLLAWRSQALVVLDDLLRPVHTVSVDAPLAESLRVFRTGQQHISLVKDRSPEATGRRTLGDRPGRTRGLLTLEDAVEAIVGPVSGEPNP